MSRPLVALSGLWVPIGVLTYLYRALRGGADVLRVGTWPDEGGWQPWDTGDGKGGMPTSLRSPEPHLLVTEGPSGRVTYDRDDPTVMKTRERPVDLWIDVDGGWSWTADLPIEAKRRALLITDPHCVGWRDEVYADMRERVDEVWQMQGGPWMADGDRLLPYAYDREWHVPTEVEQPPHYDCSIVGQPYEARRDIARRLRRSGLRVLGPGVVGVGPEYTAAMSRAPVAVVWPLADDLPARVFEAAAMGLAVITKNVPDLQTLLPSSALDGLYVVNSIPELIATTTRVCESFRILPSRPRIDLSALVTGHSWHDRAARLLHG